MEWHCLYVCSISYLSTPHSNKTPSALLSGTFIPFTYILIWFCIFGGVGIRQHRQALELQELGTEYYQDANQFRVEDSYDCYNVPQEDIAFNDTVVFHNYLVGVTPVCVFNGTDADNAWFNVLYSFSFPNDFEHGFGTFFSIVSIIAVALYFVTSSDSGSLIVDHLASNGREEHHWLQRVFWAFTEGAVASALLVAGGADSLKALQAASILAGLPFTVIMCYQLQSIQIMCSKARENPDSRFLDLHKDDVRDFVTPIYGGIFNSFEWLLSCGRVHERRVELGIGSPTKKHVVGFFTGAILPMLPLHRILNKEYPRNKITNMATAGIYTFFWCAWIAFFISTIESYGLQVFGWTCFLINAFILSGVKKTFRAKYKLHGNILGDFVAALFFYPQIFVQLEEEQERVALEKDKGTDAYSRGTPVVDDVVVEKEEIKEVAISHKEEDDAYETEA